MPCSETRDNELALRDYVFREVVPYPASLGIEPVRGISAIRESNAVLGSAEEAVLRYRSLLRDPVFPALAQWRYVDDAQFPGGC